MEHAETIDYQAETAPAAPVKRKNSFENRVRMGKTERIKRLILYSLHMYGTYLFVCMNKNWVLSAMVIYLFGFQGFLKFIATLIWNAGLPKVVENEELAASLET